MDITKYIKKCCIEKNDMQLKELAAKTEQTRQNLSNKMRHNDFRTSDLEKIANALDADLLIQFIDRQTNQPII